MALWGQGDARWICEEREDAKNVNNWHWSEVDASGPSKKFFKEKFMALTETGSEGSVRISEVSISLIKSLFLLHDQSPILLLFLDRIPGFVTQSKFSVSLTNFIFR